MSQTLVMEASVRLSTRQNFAYGLVVSSEWTRITRVNPQVKEDEGKQ